MAKHDAAKNMLSLLSDKKDEDQNQAASSSTSTNLSQTLSLSEMQPEFTNYIGLLQVNYIICLLKVLRFKLIIKIT